MEKQTFETILNFIKENTSKTALQCIDIALELNDYSSSLLELINTGNRNVAMETIAHDYNGLKSNDEHFLPRLKAN